MCTLDSGIAVHSYIGIQRSISWTLGLQFIAQISTNKHGSGLPVPPGETFGPRVYSFVPTTNKQNLNHKKTGNPISRTSPFICFGAHQQPHSTILTLVTIPDASFSESKARCRMGHETRKRGTTSSGANSPAILAFLQKGGQGQKLFYFCDFFCGTHFCVRHEANN